MIAPVEISFVEINHEETGGTSSSRCVWALLNGEHYLRPTHLLTQDLSLRDLSKYPCSAKTVAGYVRHMRFFEGETKRVPPESLNYFLHSCALSLPGAVEVDLPRYTSFRINQRVIYDKNMGTAATAETVLFELDKVLPDASERCSKLLTQATLAGPTVDFIQKFSHAELGYQTTSQLTSDVAIKVDDLYVEIQMFLIFGVRDMKNLENALRAEELHIQGYSLISRKITILKEALKAGSSEGATIEDTFSKFFVLKRDVFREHKLLLNSL